MGGVELSRWKICIAALAVVLAVTAPADRGVSASQAADLEPIRELLDRGEYSKAIEELIAFRSRRPQQMMDKRALYLLGHASARAGNSLDALMFFSRAALVYGEMADYAMYNIAKTLASVGDYNRATLAYRKLRTFYPRSRLIPRALLGEAESLLALGQCRWASAVLEKMLNRYPDIDSAPDALEKAALCYEKAGSWYDAFRIYKKLYIDYPASPQADNAGQKLKAIASEKAISAPIADEREAIARALGLYRAALFERAAAEFKTLAQTSSSASIAAVASFKLGASLRRTGERDEAFSAFVDYAERFPEEPDVPEALYNALATSLRDRSENRAGELLRRIESLYPRHEVRAKSLLAIGAYAEKKRNFKSALALYGRLERGFKGSPFATEALWRSGWIEYRSGNHRDAAKQFQSIAKLYPGSPYKRAAIFWTAYCYENLGDKGKAIPAYQGLAARERLSYYGVAAEDRLKRLRAPATPDEFDFSRPSALKPDSPAGDGPEIVQREEFHLVRLRELTVLGFAADAYEELKVLEELLPRERRYMTFLGQLYRDSGFTRDSIRSLSEALYRLSFDERKKLPLEFWSMLYPRDFWDKAVKYSTESGLDPYIVLSIMRQESAFDSKAVSSSGALGLMQIMPSTGRWLFSKRGMDNLNIDSLFDSELNISLGAGYFADLLKSHDNNLPLALASYNAGSGRVKSWLKEAGGQSQEEFIEFIPFDQTRNYVKNILRNYAVYKALYRPD